MNDSPSPRVCFLLMAPFTNDARVMREASALVEAGYRVRVIGVHIPGRSQKQYTVNEIEVRHIVRIRLAPRSVRNVMERFAAPAYSKGAAKKSGNRGGKSGSAAPLKKLRMVLAAAYLWAKGYLIQLNILLISFQLARAAREFCPDIIHANDLVTLPAAWLCRKKKRQRIVYDSHEVAVERSNMNHPRLWGWIESKLSKKADVIMFTTRTRAEDFARRYDREVPEVIRNVPEYVNLERRRIFHELFGLPETEKIVLYQGGVFPGRGIENLVRVAAGISEGTVVIVGNGALKPHLLRMKEDLKIGDRLRFLDTVPLKDLPHYTASADIGIQILQNINFNHYSTLSNKFFEYLMAGLPVVASDFPEIRRIATEFECGMLVDPDDEEQIAAAVNRLLEDDELRNRFSANARTAVKEHNWNNEKRRFIDLYAKLV
ncbi:glycosyltransferase family 4 protein [Candidatus Hydrogenedentota bacterium]